MNVVVIGAGIVGLTCAERLERSGHSVTVVDALGPQRDGASFGNAGIVVPSHFIPLAAPGVVRQGIRWLFDKRSPFYLQPRLDRDLVAWGLAFLRSATVRNVDASAPILAALNLRSRQLYEPLVERVGRRTRLVREGLLVLCRTEHALEEERTVARRAETFGLRVETLDAAAIRERIGVEVDVVGGCHYLDDAHLSPASLMADLQDHLERRGVAFAWDWSDARIELTSSGVLVLGAPARVLHADRVVVATGTGTSALLAPLGVRLPLQAGRGYSFVTPIDGTAMPRVPAILAEARVATTPLPHGLRVGGTMEIVARTAPPSSARVEGIALSASGYFPSLRDAILEASVKTEAWSGFRPCSPDGVPYIGPLSRHPSVIVAAGHAMMGVSMAPITAEIVGAFVDGEPQQVPPEALRRLVPERFMPSG